MRPREARRAPALLAALFVAFALLVLPASPSRADEGSGAADASASADGEVRAAASRGSASLEADGPSSSAGDGGQASASSQLDARAATLVPADDELTDAQAQREGGSTGFLPAGLTASDATHVTIARLASADTSLDGTLVTFIGEVVGEPVSTTSGKWVQVQASGGSAILVAMSDDAAALIQNHASYGTRGSTLRITGIYRVADPNNYGDLDVTAYVVTLIDEGGAQQQVANVPLLLAGLGFAAAAGVLAVLGIHLRRRRP